VVGAGAGATIGQIETAFLPFFVPTLSSFLSFLPPLDQQNNVDKIPGSASPVCVGSGCECAGGGAYHHRWEGTFCFSRLVCDRADGVG
jgi:hypothetical protein